MLQDRGAVSSRSWNPKFATSSTRSDGMDEETLWSGRPARRRRKRQSDAEVREAMLEAASLVAEAGGLTVSLEHLSLEDIITRAGVSRSAVYRLWPYKDAFFIKLLRDLAGPKWHGTAAFDQETIDL